VNFEHKTKKKTIEVLYLLRCDNKRPIVMKPVPYIPINATSKESCFSLLLLFSAWRSEPEMETAIENCAQMCASGNLGPDLVDKLSMTRGLQKDLENTDEAVCNDDLTEQEARDLIPITSENKSKTLDLLSVANAKDYENEGLHQVPASVFANYQLFIEQSTETFKNFEDTERNRYLEDSELLITELEKVVAGFHPTQKATYEHAVGKIRNGEKIRMIVSGEGGTGKSRLLKGLELFAVGNWHTAKSPIAKMAFTGTAAFNIRGNTIHRWTGVGSNLPLDGCVSAKKLEDLKEMWEPIHFIVVDEFSMVGTDLFTHLDKVVRKAKNIDEPFGGCHIVAFGDFYQLLPVCNNSLADDTKHSYGRTLWIDQMWDYFELTTRMRFVTHENCCKDGMCNHISFCYTECGSSRP